ncbi:MAG TPA: hypothetical protein VHG92_00470 [Afifellaceae bacterium]|nr:hypothetical protein [Afifellaceae bacterium]
MHRAAAWSRFGPMLAWAAILVLQPASVASAEPYRFASPPGVDSILVFKLDVPTGEVQACGYESVSGGVGRTKCYTVGTGAGPQQPGQWALHTTHHEGEYGVTRVNPETGAISYCYLDRTDITVCTEPLAAQQAGQAQSAPAAKVGGGMAALQPAAANVGEATADGDRYRFISPPAADSIRVYRLDTRTGEVVGCEYQSVQGGIGATKCYAPGTGAMPSRPGSWALHTASHRGEHGVVRVEADRGLISYCYVAASDATVCTEMPQ